MEEPCNEKRSLFLCYPDDFEGETESLGLRCLHSYEGDVVREFLLEALGDERASLHRSTRMCLSAPTTCLGLMLFSPFRGCRQWLCRWTRTWPFGRALLFFFRTFRETLNAVTGYPCRRAFRGLCEHEAGPVALGSDHLSRVPGGIGVKVPLHPQGGCLLLSFPSRGCFRRRECDWSSKLRKMV